MLTGITLENFKAFKEPQFIPIKPITLVFGQNNSGKSSIFHALAFLTHVHRTNGNCNPGRMRFGWSELELGPWQNLLFGHDKTLPMNIKLHTKETSIQWRFESTASGPAVTNFLIEENGVATAKGKNIGIDGIKWEVELHSSHWLWREFRAALWKEVTGRNHNRIHTFAEQAEELERRKDDEIKYGKKDVIVQDCGTTRQDEFDHHFDLWLGDLWRRPPIDCHSSSDSTNAFEGLFPRRAFADWTFNEPEAWTELRAEGSNYSNDSDIPF